MALSTLLMSYQTFKEKLYCKYKNLIGINCWSKIIKKEIIIITIMDLDKMNNSQLGKLFNSKSVICVTFLIYKL